VLGCHFPSFSKALVWASALVCSVVSSCSKDDVGDLCASIEGGGDGLHLTKCPRGSVTLTQITYDAAGSKDSYAFVATCGTRSARGTWSHAAGLSCIDGGYPCDGGACTPTSDVDCEILANCAKLGECGYVDGKCVLTDKGCSLSEIPCGLQGACHLGADGTCTVMSDADCQMPFGTCPDCAFKGPCITSGNCNEENGVCVAREDGDCKNAQQCAFAGKCTLKDGACIALTNTDCAGSEICRTAGQCTAVDGSCAVP